jgi:hypothetical protein
MFRGHMRLVVNKWGRLTPHPDGIASTPTAPATVNTKNDKSATEYELADEDAPADDRQNEQVAD